MTDPLDPAMSGDDFSDHQVAERLHLIYQELQRCYDGAKFGGDALGRRAYGLVLDAVLSLEEHHRGHGSAN